MKLKKSPFKNPHCGLEHIPKATAHELKRLSKGYLVTLSQIKKKMVKKGIAVKYVETVENCAGFETFRDD